MDSKEEPRHSDAQIMGQRRADKDARIEAHLGKEVNALVDKELVMVQLICPTIMNGFYYVRVVGQKLCLVVNRDDIMI